VYIIINYQNLYHLKKNYHVDVWYITKKYLQKILNKNLTILILLVAGQVHLLYNDFESATHGPVGANRERTHPQPVPVVDGESTFARAREACQSIRLRSALRARWPTSAASTARLLHLHRQLLQQLVHVDRRRERGHLRPAAKAGSADATQAQCQLQPEFAGQRLVGQQRQKEEECHHGVAPRRQRDSVVFIRSRECVFLVKLFVELPQVGEFGSAAGP
jgi:hypothetical protein